MKHIDVPRPDYAKNHEEAKRRAKSELPMPADVPAPAVVRHERIELNCSNKLCGEPKFTASFDEVQRSLNCPSCGKEVQIPQQYWGTP